MVAAEPADLSEVDAVVRTIDVRGPRDAARVRTVFLKHARAGQMAPLVEQLLAGEARRAERGRAAAGAALAVEPSLRVIADERLNAVVISATPAALDAAEEMLQQLDVAPGQETGRSVRVLTLRNGEATEIATSLVDLFETDDGTETPPVIRVNAASNSLLVRATDRQFTTIESVVARLDNATVTGQRAMRSVPLDPAKGDAEEMARLLRRLMENGDGEVEVITVEELLKRYDEKPAAQAAPSAPSAPAPAAGAQGALWPPPLPARLAFVTLAFASPLQAQSGAADAAQQADAKEQSGVTVAVDKETNSLLLLGSPREIERAMRLIEQASKSLPAEGSRIRAIQLPASADPTSLASVVVGTIARMTPPGGAVGDLAKRVAVIADPERRALLVVASDRDF